METVTIVVHLLVVVTLILVILLQRSEGGALGIGGGGGGGGFMSGRGAANILTRVTAALAIAFFLTSLFLAILARWQSNSVDLAEFGATATDSELSAEDLLRALKPADSDAGTSEPDNQTIDNSGAMPQAPRIPTPE